MPRIAKSVRITGRVQGVFFRAWTAEHAREFGVTGWVQNCPDESVQAHLEGDDASVEALITLLHRGPPSAKVEQIQVDEAQLTNADRFEVRH